MARTKVSKTGNKIILPEAVRLEIYIRSYEPFQSLSCSNFFKDSESRVPSSFVTSLLGPLGWADGGSCRSDGGAAKTGVACLIQTGGAIRTGGGRVTEGHGIRRGRGLTTGSELWDCRPVESGIASALSGSLFGSGSVAVGGSSLLRAGAEKTGILCLIHTGGAIRTGGAVLITGGAALADL